MSADVRHDAVAAAVVASEKNRDERLPSALDVGVHAFRNHVLAEFEARIAPFLENPRNEAEGARTYGEVELGKSLEDVRPEPLDGAAHEPYALLRGD